VTSVSLRGRPGGFTSGTGTLNLRERVQRVYAYRRILGLLVRRDLKVRYAGSALGYVWTVLDPLLMTLVYFVVFTQIFHRTAGPEFKPYVLYLVTGQLPWFWFSGAVLATTKALRSESQMVRSSNVPRELWVLRVVMSKGMEYLFGLPILAIFALAYLTGPNKYLVLLPLSWLLEITLLTGIGMILAPLTVLVKDVNRIVPVVLRIFFYMSPVLYSVSRLPENLQFVYQFNPTTGFLELSHAAFFPAAVDGHWDFIWHSALWAVGVLAIGIFVFARLERAVLKEI
jgi:ABC-2 type transport system permease protein